MTRASATRLPRSPVHDLQRRLVAGFAGDRPATRWSFGLPGWASTAAGRLPRTPVGRRERVLSVGLIGGAAATILLAQLVTVFLNEWPSSAMLWKLYFEFARPFDVYFQLLRSMVGEPSLFGFATVVLGVALATTAAVLSGVRLLRAIAYHVLLAMTGILIYFTGVPADAVTPIFGAQSPSIAAVASLLALLSLVQCLRLHRDILRAAGVSRRLALAVEPASPPVPQPMGPQLATDAGRPSAPRAATLPPAKLDAA